MQTSSSRIWPDVTESIFHDDNDYVTSAIQIRIA